MHTVLEYLSERKFGLAFAAGIVAGTGLIAAWLTPRGPATAPEALVSMAEALIIGLAAGLVTGSRWSMLFTPAVFVVVFELARLGVDGPTVDGIHPVSSIVGQPAYPDDYRYGQACQPHVRPNGSVR